MLLNIHLFIVVPFVGPVNPFLFLADEKADDSDKANVDEEKTEKEKDVEKDEKKENVEKEEEKKEETVKAEENNDVKETEESKTCSLFVLNLVSPQLAEYVANTKQNYDCSIYMRFSSSLCSTIMGWIH